MSKLTCRALSNLRYLLNFSAITYERPIHLFRVRVRIDLVPTLLYISFGESRVLAWAADHTHIQYTLLLSTCIARQSAT